MLQHCDKLEWFDLSHCRLITKETLRNANFNMLRRTGNNPLNLILKGINNDSYIMHNLRITTHIKYYSKKQN
jgi:hypothetical protein